MAAKKEVIADAASMTAPHSVVTASVYLRLSSDICNRYSIDNTVIKTRDTQNRAEKQYSFSNIFNYGTTQAKIYNECIIAAIDNEQDLTILTYGTSGSGKTFTLMGQSVSGLEPGIIPRAIEHIFEKYTENISENPSIKNNQGKLVILDDKQIQAEKNLRLSALVNAEPLPEYYQSQRTKIHKEHNYFPNIDAENDDVFIYVSFAEINDCVNDLLATLPKPKALSVFCNNGNAFINDLKKVHVLNSAEAYRLLISGQKRCSFASTNINGNSSRSHCIFFMDVIRLKRETKEVLSTTYKFCDLAGSERLTKTGNTGDRLKEAKQINSSLMVLGKCLDAVLQKKKNVPFRDSKLTRLLQAPLLGKEKLTMIVNMKPTADFISENNHVLNFASKARQILYKAPTRKAALSARFSLFLLNASTRSGSIGLADDSQTSILMGENKRLVPMFKISLLFPELRTYYFFDIRFLFNTKFRLAFIC